MSFKRVIEWNRAAGKMEYTFSAVEKQIGYTVEEIDELLEAVDNHDALEQLDAVCDIMFTYYQLFHQVTKSTTLDVTIGQLPTDFDPVEAAKKLKNVITTATNASEVMFAAHEVESIKKHYESLGYDVESAFKAVCDNNDMKFIYSREDALEVANTLEKASSLSHTIVELVDKEGYWVRRDVDGKISKAPWHRPVNLVPFLPKH